MCEFDRVVKRYKTSVPLKAHKVFGGLKDNLAYFEQVRGSVPRGEWVHCDSPKVQNGGSRCEFWEKGFHCFPHSVKVQSHYGDGYGNFHGWQGSIPVQLKGWITIAKQFGEEIVVGEWMYVPTVEELEREIAAEEELKKAA